MLARIRKAQDKDSGFTLIELLVVMIIIGILAAIAIPAFLSQKNKAKGTSAKSDVSNIGREISAYFVDNGPMTATALTGSAGAWSLGPAATPVISGKLSPGNKVVGSVTSENNFCVAVWNTDVDTADPAAGAAGTGSVYKYQPAGGVSKGNCP